MATIALEGMRFFARHGVFEEEKVNGNTFEVDVWLDTGDRALPQSDALSDALDYGKVYAAAAEAMDTPVDLLETLVQKIGHKCLQAFPGELDLVRVRVSKLNPPVAGACARSYVEASFCP